MIFNGNYDRTLWMILKGDKKNRNKIIDFIKSIPYQFVLMIQESLAEYEKYKLENDGIPLNDREYRCFDKQIYNSIGELYSFSIDIKNDVMSICRSVYNYGAYYNDFDIKLINYDSNMNLFDWRDIGSISYDFNNQVVTKEYAYLGDFSNVDYAIMNSPFGKILLSSNNNGIIRLCGIDNGEIPDYNVDNISSRLVRTRKISMGKDRKNV